MNLYSLSFFFFFFFFNDTATTEIYTLSLHDALPSAGPVAAGRGRTARYAEGSRVFRPLRLVHPADRKSTRLNSSHTVISYAVFCLKKKKKTNKTNLYKKKKNKKENK